MSDRFHAYFHQAGASAANGVVVSANPQCLVHTVTLGSTTAAAATASLYNNNSAGSSQSASNLVGSWSVGASAGPPVTVILDVVLPAGAVLVTTGAGCDCTVSFS